MTPSPCCPSIASTLRNWTHRHLSQLGPNFGHMMLCELSTMDFWGERVRHDTQPVLPQHSQYVEGFLKNFRGISTEFQTCVKEFLRNVKDILRDFKELFKEFRSAAKYSWLIACS